MFLFPDRQAVQQGLHRVLKVDKLQVHGLPPLTFEVAGGECLAIEGPSGSGKTLLLRAIADLDPAEGDVSLVGTERRAMPAARWRKQVRYVAAEPRWWAPTAAAHFSDPTRGRALQASLGLDPASADKPIDVLSTGERQRLALIRALLDDPMVLLLDEPTGALDGERRDLVEALIRSELAAGATVLLVSHDKGQIERLSHARLQLAPPAHDAVTTENIAEH